MKTVLVTGAGSGIGRCIAERRAAQGHRVWACARRPEHLQALGRVAGVVPVALDVRDAAQVEAVEHALFDAVPRARYLVGTRWEGLRVVDALLDRLLDADEGVGMGRGRDALVARLDERLAARRAK